MFHSTGRPASPVSSRVRPQFPVRTVDRVPDHPLLRQPPHLPDRTNPGAVHRVRPATVPEPGRPVPEGGRPGGTQEHLGTLSLR